MMRDLRPPEETNELDRKISEAFPGRIVRKDLAAELKEHAPVPSYVVEHLLSDQTAKADPTGTDDDVARVRTMLATNAVRREEAPGMQSRIRERGFYDVIDQVQVTLNGKLDQYEARFSNLGINQVTIDAALVVRDPKLLTTGIWCMCRIGYKRDGASRTAPWRILDLKPLQTSRDDREHYIAMRPKFSDEEWIDLLMRSVGLNPSMFGERIKLLHLVRLIPFVESNYRLLELGPKGTGKSHTYTEFSPHGTLVSDDDPVASRLFRDDGEAPGDQVRHWDTVAFDEFSGRDLVATMKRHMDGPVPSATTQPERREASLAFEGNTSHNVPYLLKHADLFDELPPQYHDPDFLDRIHYFLPGWEFEQVRAEVFSHGYGFVVDYLAQILHRLREIDFSRAFERHFTLSRTLSAHDREGVAKTFSGLMKLMHPDGQASAEQMQPLLRCAMEGRKRVTDQLHRMDGTTSESDFSYTRVGPDVPVAVWISVHTLEEGDYPELYGRRQGDGNVHDAAPSIERTGAQEGHVAFTENQTGVTYDGLFGPYIAGAARIVLKDPYIRKPYQIRNFTEFLETVLMFTDRTEEVHVHLVTRRNDGRFASEQTEKFSEIQSTFGRLGITFTYEFDDTGHDRSIVTDTGWRVVPGRGLDIYQPYNDGNWLNPLTRRQQLRRVRAFEVTTIRTDQSDI